jgi:hypothetical protein
MLVTILPISIAGLYSISQSEAAMKADTGNHFKTIAESTAAEISQFIHDRLGDVAVLAVEPTIVDTVLAANRSYGGMSEAAITGRMQQVEESWNRPASEPLVKGILSSRASAFLRRFRDLDRRFLRVTVTDEKGGTVAATHKTIDYYQADEEFWQDIYAGGRGGVSITDVLYDELTKSHYIGIGVPVLEEGSQRFLGAVDALVDISSLLALANRMQASAGGRILLVKDDGTVIVGPQLNLAMNVKSGEYAALADDPGTANRQSGYAVTDVSGGGRTLIGFADTGLKRDYGKLGWVVLVSQSTAEAFRPMRYVGRLLAFMSLLGLGAIALLGAYFGMHRDLHFADIEALHASKGATP